MFNLYFSQDRCLNRSAIELMCVGVDVYVCAMFVVKIQKVLSLY